MLVEIPKAFFSKRLVLRGLFASDLLSPYCDKFRFKNYKIIGLLDVAFYQVPDFTEKVKSFSLKEVFHLLHTILDLPNEIIQK